MGDWWRMQKEREAADLLQKCDNLSEVKPGSTIYYEAWYRPGSTSVAYYAVNARGNRTKISAAAASKARRAKKKFVKLVLVPSEYEVRYYAP